MEIETPVFFSCYFYLREFFKMIMAIQDFL